MSEEIEYLNSLIEVQEELYRHFSGLAKLSLANMAVCRDPINAEVFATERKRNEQRAVACRTTVKVLRKLLAELDNKHD